MAASINTGGLVALISAGRHPDTGETDVQTAFCHLISAVPLLQVAGEFAFARPAMINAGVICMCYRELCTLSPKPPGDTDVYESHAF
jgi:hypothetical protein